MAKPKVSLRKAPKVETEAMDAFVDSGIPEVQKSKIPKVKDRQQTTLYLSADVKRRLKFHAVYSGKEMSQITEEALLAYLPAGMPEV